MGGRVAYDEPWPYTGRAGVAAVVPLVLRNTRGMIFE